MANDILVSNGDLAEFLEAFEQIVINGDFVSASDTRLISRLGDMRMVVTGTGFTFTPEGDVVSGDPDRAVIKIQTPAGPQNLGTIVNIGFSVADVATAARAEGTGDHGALERFLMGVDWHFIGTDGADISWQTDRVSSLPFNPAGDDVFELAGGNDRWFAGDGDDFVWAGAGRDLVKGGRGNDRLFGQEDDDRLIGGSGRDVIDGGHGDDILYGGADGDRFVFSDGYGRDRIADLDPTEDRIDLRGTTKGTDFDAVMSLASDRSAGVVINFGGGDVLVLAGLTMADLSAECFVF